MIIIKIILVPVSILYAIVIFLRNKFYDTGIFKSHKISKPVISIGNITTGGTGKTPLTIFIANYFLKKGLKVGIVSRGYGRKINEAIIVCDGNKINDNVDESGDELILISSELISNNNDMIFAAAGSDRIKTANLLIDKFNPDVIILDDAFQNRRIKRDLDIVIIDATDLRKKTFFGKFTIPSGNLRENFFNLKRADVIIQNNKDSNIETQKELSKLNKPVITIRYKSEYFIDYKNCILENKLHDVILFSGIANDVSFKTMAALSGMNVTESIKFQDHHNYTISDIELLKKKYTSGKIFITTEKDFIKVRQFQEFIKNYPVFFLKMKIEITNHEDQLYGELNKIIK